jgi:hypothetical protein
MAVTIENIKGNIQSADLTAITGNDDNIISTCINDAQIFVDVYIQNSGKTVAEEVKDSAVIKRTLCGLYRYSGDFAVSREFYDDAKTILESAVGVSETQTSKTSGGHVVAGSTDWKGF